MMKKQALRSAVVLSVVPVLMLSACGGGGDKKPNSSPTKTSALKVKTVAEDPTDVCDDSRKGGTLTYRMQPEGPLDPAVSQSNMNATGAIYGTLLKWNNADAKFEGDLAESITGNEDSTQWTLKLRDDVVYPDGKPLDAAAVKQNIERYLDPAFASAFTGRIADVTSMTVQDPTTLVFKLKSSWGTFPWLLTQSPGMIVNPAVLADTKPETLAAAPPADAGAGAFVFKSYERGQSQVVTAKSDWWGGPVCLDELTFSFGANDSNADYQAQQSGQINAFFVYDSNVVEKIAKDANLNLYELPEAIGSPVLLNTQKPPFDDVRIRQALSYSFDRDLINSRTYAGLALATASIVPPTFPDQPTVKGLDYDANKAADLVKEASADGTTTTLSYLVTPNPSNENLAILQQALAKKSGLSMKPDYLQIPDWIERVFTSHNFEAAMGGMTVPTSCPACGLDQFGSTSPTNVGGYKSSEMDAALVQLKAARPGAETSAALDALQTVWNKDMPAPITIWIPQFLAIDQNVGGLAFSSSAYQIHFEKAYIRK